MSDENLFDNKDPVVNPPQAPVLPDHLKELIGEGKKYASVEKALEALPHAQSHIQKIEDENRKYREELQNAKAAEEAYKKLMEDLDKPPVHTPPVVAGLDEASVATLLDRKLAERENQQRQAENVKRVLDGMKEKYGDKAQEVYEAKAKELGVGTGFLNDIVKHSPKAAEELFGIKPKDKAAPPSSGSVNTAVLNNRPRDDKPVRGPLSGGNLMDAWNRAKESIKE